VVLCLCGSYGGAFRHHELHRDVVRAVTLADFVDMRDVGMVERRGRLCLAHKALHAIAIRGHVGRQSFQCDLASSLVSWAR